MKIGIFSDVHYSSQTLKCGVRKCSLSLGKLERAYERFVGEGCGLCICLGDLIDRDGSREKDALHLREAGEVFRSSGIETLCVRGNHDAFTFGKDEYYRVPGITEPSDRIVCGKRLVFPDTCYFGDGTPYPPRDGDWTDCYFPGADKLPDRLRGDFDEAVVFVHHNIDPAIPEDHRLANGDVMFDIIQKSGKVKTVYQGHFHPGKTSVYNGIKYITLPAVCEREDAFYIIEI